MTSTFRLSEPCSRAYIHQPHEFSILAGSGGAYMPVDIICPGWGSHTIPRPATEPVGGTWTPDMQTKRDPAPPVPRKPSPRHGGSGLIE